MSKTTKLTADQLAAELAKAHRELAEAREISVARLDQWQAWQRRAYERERELTEAREHLADIDEAHKSVMSEQCAGDERHCTCVPFLRRELASAREAIRGAVPVMIRLRLGLTYFIEEFVKFGCVVQPDGALGEVLTVSANCIAQLRSALPGAGGAGKQDGEKEDAK